MNAERQAKVAQVKEIAHHIATSKAFVIAEYAGLKVKELEEIRQALSASGVEIKVYKNRLFHIASKEAKLDFSEHLTGPNIYAFGKDDEIAPAKVLTKFAKTFKALKLKSGLYEGKVIGAKELVAIASLPSLEEARGMLAMSLLGPLRYLAMGLNMLTENEKLLASATSTGKPKAEAKQGDSQGATTSLGPDEVKVSQPMAKPKE